MQRLITGKRKKHHSHLASHKSKKKSQMARTQDISATLRRKLEPGKKYDKLIPAVSCVATDLGEGDTFHTVEEMRDWITKYSWQTSKLAPLLNAGNLQQLAENIYRFLYNHVQYEADGALQQISSPACTWNKRKEGVDCKSFSVFASSILTNLGINHAIRQVRQPGFNPDNFTHVYVVVFQDQDQQSYSNDAPTFVIDATRHHNEEVTFLEKSDLMMLQHVGLNAPSEIPTQKIMEDNFKRFCLFLKEHGVAVATVQALIDEVYYYLNREIDPEFQIIEHGVSVNGKPFTFQLDTDIAYQKEIGLGVVVTGAAALTAGKALMKMLPSDFLGNTFGAIFANGFDLSCWNASYSESKAQEALTVDIPYLLNEYSGLPEALQNGNINLINQKFDVYLNAMAGYIADSQNGQRSKFASCTRKGYALREKGAREAREQVISILKSQGFQFTKTGTQPGLIETHSMPSYAEGTHYRWGHKASTAYDYETYELTLPNGSTNDTVNVGGNSDITNGQDITIGDNYNQDESGSQVPINNTNQGATQAGMGYLAPIVLSAIGIPLALKYLKK